MSLPHTSTTESDSQSHDLGPAVAAVSDKEREGVAEEEGKTVDQQVDTGDDTSLYQLKWVEWKGGFVPIITQNENGPCPLLALCNVLLLSERMRLVAGETVVTSTQLLDLLGTTVIENMPEDLSDGDRANYEQNIQDAMATFHKLQTGLDVNVRYDSVKGFEFTSETVIFDLLNVPLYHGWLPDPQDTTTYSIVRGCSYNQLVEMVVSGRSESDPEKLQRALTAEQFLDSTASQLTYCGMCELGGVMEEGELAVFFRNNHFSTVLKRKGHLLLLVTDHGFVNEHGHIWQTLSSTDGDESFMDARFRPSAVSEVQQEREHQGVESQSQATPTTTTTDPTVSRDVDYQTALNLQQEEYRVADMEAPPQSQPHSQIHTVVAGPNTAEEYEQASQADRHHRQGQSICTIS
jgi:hypothetical protein